MFPKDYTESGDYSENYTSYEHKNLSITVKCFVIKKYEIYIKGAHIHESDELDFIDYVEEHIDDIYDSFTMVYCLRCNDRYYPDTPYEHYRLYHDPNVIKKSATKS